MKTVRNGVESAPDRQHGGGADPAGHQQAFAAREGAPVANHGDVR